MTNTAAPVSRPAGSAAVTDLGWRYVGHRARSTVRVRSLAEAARVAQVAAQAVPTLEKHLAIDLRVDQVVLTALDPDTGVLTEADLIVVRTVTAALIDAGFLPVPGDGRGVQVVELAIDAMDIPAVRPFWQAALGYVEDPSDPGPDGSLLDPTGQGPSVWFQQMDSPREQRNRLHLDVDVPHDQVQDRLAATLAAGGTLLSDAHARAFWVLADAEGNEVCLCTWQDRERPG
ncbi:4a-hydroxytetrahydrobiopterin dehydratase [Nakamurella flavida]|uniref:4a-hydroxytetrahydrobiopterin dehydratase n=1 Tax=Nakamurella flavida TaxID=363630 RepID=A0A938YLA0_9ACTN|nr:VOC family protein [Nakamurella flavida]MBM9478087.1 4a-hydroxytetrahydrobiopterin dehydratase [Nakamurella flavida]MDP9778692.1 4a-hydroxytetrahydrobiopterin dehydratase [Nakamurella flavida]